MCIVIVVPIKVCFSQGRIKRNRSSLLQPHTRWNGLVAPPTSGFRGRLVDSVSFCFGGWFLFAAAAAAIATIPDIARIYRHFISTTDEIVACVSRD